MNGVVSIIVPVYNIQEYLPSCLESILEQTYTNIEIVIVDDGSTDSSGQISDRYAIKNSNIKVIHKDNAGLGFARNAGIDNATGDYITFVDGDDYITPDHIRNLISFAETENLDACYGGFCQRKRNELIPVSNPLAGNIFTNDEIIQKFVPYLCGKYNHHIVDDVQMSACMVLYKLSVIMDNSIRFHSEREFISEDFVFNLDFLEKAKIIAATDECGYCYQVREESLTHSYKADRLMKQTYLTKYIVDRTRKLGIFDKCEQRIYSTYLTWVRAIIRGEQKNYKQNGYKESIKNIRNVCDDSFVIDIINKYDESNFTIKLWIINRLIKYKKCRLLWFLSFLKNLL